jgi:spore coat polysaccharide biosynthesis protein SpsF (cytidylyltransferase family)
MPSPGIYSKWEWKTVRNYDEFVSYITKNGLPDFISFDHDLSDEHYNPDMYNGQEIYNKHYAEFKEKTGMDCAKWLVDYCMDNKKELPDFVVHSMNPAGGENIKLLLDQFKEFQHKNQ